VQGTLLLTSPSTNFSIHCSLQRNLDTSFDDDCGYGGDYGDDDDAGFGDCNQENMPPALPPVLSGLSINESQLLQADRKVEKIEIG
jgi:hypothetical protein